MSSLAAPALLALTALVLLIGSGGRWPRAGLCPLRHQWTLRAATHITARRWRLRAAPAQAAAELPLALDLLACTLRAGQPLSAAAAAVSSAVGGPVGGALLAVARAVDLGAPADVAWQPLGQLASAAGVARTVARTSESGTRLADELCQIASEQRVRQAAAVATRVRRAGVWVVLPLGFCFLPAFVLIGVVPIVIGIARSVLR